MLKRLLGKAPIDVWVIKQVDIDLLHLCGRATLEARPNRQAVLAALEEGRFAGAVKMATGGVVLNARLFQALVPVEQLELLPEDQARWRGRDWSLSQVPQRCWTFQGRLTAQPDPTFTYSGLISSEDIAGIRQRVAQSTPQHPGEVVFRPENANEAHPLVARQEDGPRDGMRPKAGREWRRDSD
ncbi:MAG: hypothetical protein IBX53_02565 [Halomonas sp.]|uniref:hypothetical protein n=1 Tax=Halomonas sp. TaxID=1486246 RepID=UPI001A0AF025|nr:hypothetical protein [Halomonas sp.]MBE0487936.1 hypothetical protein [Halomonas sp.]